MSFYNEIIADVSAVLAELGQEGSVIRMTLIGGSASDPDAGTETPSTYPANMALFPVGDRVVGERVGSTAILASDFQCIVEPVEIEVTANDQIKCSEGTMVILKLGKIAPAGKTVAYDMIVRG